MTQNNDDIEEIYLRLEKADDLDVHDIEPHELLLLLHDQIENLMYLSGLDSDAIDLNRLIPGNEQDRSFEEDFQVKTRSNNKLKYNFQDLDLIDKAASKRQSLIKKFYLKQVPSLGTLQYLERIFKHCSLSTSVILTCAVYLFNFVLGVFYDHQQLNFNDLSLLPLDKLNFYRIILTAIRVSSKFIEDKNFKSKHYCKIVGLNPKEYLNLELNFMFLIDFRFYVNEIILKDVLKLMRRLNQFTTSLKRR